MSDLIIVGAGGHSRAVISAALFSKNWNIIGVIDNNFQEEENILEYLVLENWIRLILFQIKTQKFL